MATVRKIELESPFKELYGSAELLLTDDGRPVAVGFLCNIEKGPFISFDRYLKSVEVGKILSLAEYDEILCQNTQSKEKKMSKIHNRIAEIKQCLTSATSIMEDVPEGTEYSLQELKAAATQTMQAFAELNRLIGMKETGAQVIFDKKNR